MDNHLAVWCRSRRKVVRWALAMTCAIAAVATAIATRPPEIAHALLSLPVRIASEPARTASGWALLTPAQQRTLAPLKSDWERLDPEAKVRWLAVAGRLQGRPSLAAARAAKRMHEWQHLTATARAQARLHYVIASRMSAAERQRRWDAYQATGSAPLGKEAPASKFTMVSPSLARGRDGATTMLLTNLSPGPLPLVRAGATTSASPGTPVNTAADLAG